MDPFTTDKGQSISELGEKALIVKIREWLGSSAPQAPNGMGDDCAVFENAARGFGLLTTDSVVLDRHFSRSDPPHLIGQKLLNRNISDIAAMGGQPTRAVLAGFLPATLSLEWLHLFFTGLAQTAQGAKVEIVGGDLTETPHDLAINLTLMGIAHRPLLRSGGSPGDLICVTGELGGSRLGRHLSFVPRIEEGLSLAQNSNVLACMDISDGLSIDLPAILGENCAASIDPDAIPIHDDARKAAALSGQSPLWHALNDGEDHELLFIKRAAGKKSPLPKHTVIGTLLHGKTGTLLNAKSGKDLTPSSGYEHFR